MRGLGLYLPTPDPSLAPGAGLVERYDGGRFGLGNYVATEHYLMSPAAAAGIQGMGCGCAGGGCSCGMGQTGIFGSSLFESTDPSTWGWGEWTAIAAGGYLLISVLSTTKRAARASVRKGRAVRKALAA